MEPPRAAPLRGPRERQVGAQQHRGSRLEPSHPVGGDRHLMGFRSGPDSLAMATPLHSPMHRQQALLCRAPPAMGRRGNKCCAASPGTQGLLLKRASAQPLSLLRLQSAVGTHARVGTHVCLNHTGHRCLHVMCTPWLIPGTKLQVPAFAGAEWPWNSKSSQAPLKIRACCLLGGSSRRAGDRSEWVCPAGDTTRWGFVTQSCQLMACYRLQLCLPG